MIIHGRHTYPPAPLPSLRPDWTTFLAPAAKSRFIWFGHSTLLMRIGGQTLITDPVFGDNVSPVPFTMRRFQPPAATVAELPPLDVVLISHNHYDHLERATHKRLAHGHAHYLVPLGVGVQLQRWGIPAARISEMDWWQSIERNGIRYTALPARHYSGRGMFDHNRSLWVGYLIEYDNERYYFHGDSAWGQHFDAIAARIGRIDIAFIENGQYSEYWPDNHLFPEETAAVAAKLAPSRFMPIHWGAYPMALHRWNDPVLRSIPAARAHGVNPLTPLLGQIFDMDTTSDDWYRHAP
ncbi:hypothetical protein HMPREF9080_01404 [Cardiobacterium valvarum F0432]|uniref:Metallo-beta-lactamase domain-containing protein n=2 Tax=Cardiobacterium valvarum TaxID=194702 RepID=G9ZF51_9GAMM|nr:hypothetical protein HMPREF9080_01404 [Cardiobacterium valvarum F0432]